MSGRILDIHESTHQKVQSMLPWLDADSLDYEDLHLVKQHVQVCSQCQSDLDWQRKLQSLAPERTTGLDVERAFAKLRPQLLAKPRETRRSATRKIFTALTNQFVWMPWALAAQFFAIIGLSFMLTISYGNLASYRTLGAATQSGGNVAVVFKPDTSEHELRRLLLAANAKIVDGPTLTDAYVLSVPDKNLPATIASLRAEPAVVLAESLSAGGGR